MVALCRSRLSVRLSFGAGIFLPVMKGMNRADVDCLDGASADLDGEGRGLHLEVNRLDSLQQRSHGSEYLLPCPSKLSLRYSQRVRHSSAALPRIVKAGHRPLLMLARENVT